MYISHNGYEHLRPGEPTPEALHREEYFTSKPSETRPARAADHTLGERAALLRAQMLAGVGRFFA